MASDGGSSGIESQLRTLLASSALDGKSDTEKVLAISASLVSALRDGDISSAPKEEVLHENKCVQYKEFIFPGNETVYIYRHYGKNYYYREKDPKTNKWLNGESLNVGINRELAFSKAMEQFIDRQSKRSRGVLHKSINCKELVKLFLSHEQKRIKVTQKRGLTQSSYDALGQRLKYWQEYIKENGHERRPIEDIPAHIGDLFASWIDDLPKKAYRNTPRDVDTINAVVSTTKRMYHWANDRGYIGHDDIPKFKYLDRPLGYDQSEERQILWEDEWKQLSEYLQARGRDHKYKKIDQDKYMQTYWYFKLAYETGMRLKEINTLRWNQVITPTHETGHSREINRSIYLPATKTSRKRTITAPITYIFNGLLKLYKSRGIDIDTKSDTRVFFKLFTSKHDITSWYTDKAMVDKLDLAMKEIGLYQKLEQEMPPRRITPNSSRHYVATYKKVNDNWSWDDIALFLGHDSDQTQKRYSKVTSSMVSAKKDKKTGFDAIDSYVFKDKYGNPEADEIQESKRKTLVDLVLKYPNSWSVDIQDGKLIRNVKPGTMQEQIKILEVLLKHCPEDKKPHFSAILKDVKSKYGGADD